MWHTVTFNIQNFDGGRITLPKKSKWGGWRFSHPDKLTRINSQRWTVAVTFSESWTFRLSRKHDGKWQNLEVSAAEFLSEFSDSCADQEPKPFLTVEDPPALDPVEAVIPDDLVN